MMRVYRQGNETHIKLQSEKKFVNSLCNHNSNQTIGSGYRVIPCFDIHSIASLTGVYQGMTGLALQKIIITVFNQPYYFTPSSETIVALEKGEIKMNEKIRVIQSHGIWYLHKRA